MFSSKPHQDIGNHFEPIAPQECYDILMNVPVSILRSTPDGRLLSTNHTAAHKLGYKSPQELVESITDIASQIYADPGARKEILHLLEAEGIVEGHECRQLRKDGSEFWASNTMRAVRSQEGDITHYQVLILDITQRKQAEKAQQESERRFRALAEKCPTSVILFDEQGRVDFVNDWHIEKFAHNKLDKDYFLGKSIHELPGLVHAGVDTEVARIFQGESIELQEVYFPEFAAGGSGWVSIKAVPIHQDDQIAGGILIRENITAKKNIEAALQKSQQKFRSLVENVQDFLFSHTPDGHFTYLSPQVTKILGYEPQELIGRNFQEIIHPQDLPLVQKRFQKALGTSDVAHEIEHRGQHKNGEYRWLYVNVSHLITPEGEIESIVGVARDITQRKQAEEELYYQNKLLETIINGTWDILSIKQPDHTVERYNQAGYDLLGLPPEDVNGRKCFELLGRKQTCSICPSDLVLERKQPVNLEKFVPELGVYLDCRISPVFDDEGHIIKIVQHLRDITERKQMEEKLKKMSFYDFLTGLYSRNFFDEEMARIADGRYSPVGMVVCDLDGLKFVNDTMGHKAGDKMLINSAQILRQNFRSSDIIARIGGDEFAILLPQTPREVVEQIMERVRQSVQEYNSKEPDIPLSFSMGHALNEVGTTDMNVLLRDADKEMYLEKIQRKGSTRSAILQALTDSMQARQLNIQGQGDRLQELATSLAASLNLSQDFVNNLSLLTRFHDLGKVGIPDYILFKQGSLTEEEWPQIRQHCEIGHRIASSVPDLEPIADWILKHHERWDGRGYPLGLSGQEVPLACRIFAIANAYDAMTNNRPYRKTITQEGAIAELNRCAGTQFDPELVEHFTNIVRQNEF